MRKRILILLPLLFLLGMTTHAQEVILKLKVVTEQANIRLKPDIGSIIIQQVPKGTILESSGKEGDWYRIHIETEEPESSLGYVHQSLVIEISPPRTKEKEPEEVEEEPKEEPTKIRVFPPMPPPSLPARHQLDLFLSGGIDFVNGGDLNTGAQGLADFTKDSLALEGKAKINPVRLSYIFGADLSFPLLNHFSLGLGADYFLGEEESRVDFQLNSSTTHRFITRPKIQALPLRIFLSFQPISFFYLKTGVEYYFAECVYLYRYEREEGWQEWQGESKAQDFGFLGGFGLEWKVLSPLSFFLEAVGRYARIIGFEGKNTYRDSDGSVTTEEGKLYFYQGKGAGEKTYPLLFVRKNKPEGFDVSEAKEAIVDFSGISLKVGIKIRF